MHQSFVTTATSPKGKDGDYNFSAFTKAPPPANRLEVKTLLFDLPFAIENLPGVRIPKTLSFPLHSQDIQKLSCSLAELSPTLPCSGY